VLGNDVSAEEDSFANGLLEYPQYTRPAEFRGLKVPDVLLSGHHENIAKWRKKESLRRTWQRRPDLLRRIRLTPEEQRWLEEIKTENASPDNS
jgi:tRNA (guanine37-N1)-methyltransferase